MEKMKAWSALGGTKPAEKLGTIGVTEGRTLDVRFLDEIARTYGVAVILFLKKTLPVPALLSRFSRSFPMRGNLSGPILL